jgi:hypothetical protein
VTPLLSRLTSTIARAAAAVAAAAAIASCGGSVSPSPNVPDQQLIVILPASSPASQVITYSGMPTTFSITGGNGSYIIASNNQAVIPSPGSVTGSSFTIVPSPISASEVTGIVLSVRDTATAAPVSVVITVRAGTLNNDLTVTPSPTQSASCSPALCSGTDAQVRVSLSQGGVPLAARGVKFEVVSGQFTFLESPPFIAHDPPGDTSNVVTATDETGVARVRIRVAAGASDQTAQVQVKDLVTGAFRRATFAIAQFNGNTPSFFTLPSAITLSGTTVACSTGSADVAVFGGTPPYTLSGGSPGTFALSVNGVAAPPAFVASSGGKFTVSFAGTGACVETLPVAVTDATGRTITVPVTNRFGTVAPPISLAPSTLALRCGQSGSVAVVGGTEPFAAGSSDGLLLVLPPAGRVVTMNAISSGPYATRQASVSVTDGRWTAAATVTLDCP